MKWMSFLLLSLYASLATATEIKVGQNLLLNPDFENQLRFWTVKSPGKWAEGDGVEGSGALLLHGPTAKLDGYAHEVKASQCVKLGDGDQFYIEAKFRYDAIPLSATAHRINYTWFYGDNCSEGGQYGGYLEPELIEGWQTLSKSNLRPAMNAKSMLLEFTQVQVTSARKLKWYEEKLKWLFGLIGKDYQNPSAGGYWDNAFVTATSVSQKVAVAKPVSSEYTRPNGENYISNGSFDTDGTDWLLTRRAKWTLEDGHQKPGAIRTTVQSDSGGIGVGVLYQCINLGNQNRYRMGVNYKQDPKSTQAGGGRFRVTWYENEDCRGSSRADTHHADIRRVDGWQPLEVKSLKRPQLATSAEVEVIQSVDGNGAYSGFWDDAYFEGIE